MSLGELSDALGEPRHEGFPGNWLIQLFENAGSDEGEPRGAFDDVIAGHDPGNSALLAEGADILAVVVDFDVGAAP